jgi:predicted dehydrogenase
MLRVGIIGAGLLGERHADRWSRLPVKLSGVFDVDVEKAQPLADRHGARAFKSADDLARQVDIVHVATPTPFHKEGVLTAAAHGKHVFCEKPLARYPADAQEMADTCERAGVRLYVGQTLRFFGQYMAAKRKVDAGVIGEPGLIRMVRAAGHPATMGAREWFTKVENSGGAIMEGGIHDLDFARWCFGDVERVFARGLTYRDDLPFLGDHVFVTLYFKSGAAGHVEGSWMSTDGRLRQFFEIIGTDGTIAYDSHATEALTLSLRAEPRHPLLPLPPQGALAIDDDPYMMQLEHFLDCLQHDRFFRVSPQDGVEAVRLAVAALESMRTGQVVRVEDV